MPIINNLSGNEIEILKLADFLTGVEHDITDVYFGELYVFTVWAETEGALPLTVNANGEPLTDCKLYGQTVQASTPTPSSPVDVNGVGEKTGNWFDKDIFTFGTDTTIVYVPIYVGEGSFTLSTDFPENSTKDVFFMAGNVSSGASSSANGVSVTAPRTRTAIDGYVTIATRYNTNRENPANYNYMLNAGSTAQSFEPYGYKIPITCGGTTTNIYLGSATSTRRVKKLVLDGTESWSLYIDGRIWQFYTNNIISGVGNSSVMSNIADYGVTATNRANYNYGGYLVSSGRGLAFQMRGAKGTFVDVAAWSAYLAEQYANGTPVTVWYVLATPETAAVNEPLMKIGDYADEISGTGLPTLNGITVYDCDLEVKPSKMYVKYRKHET